MSRPAAKKAKTSKPHVDRPLQTLRILPRESRSVRKVVATHSIPSGMGGVFDVEVLERRDGRARVRIHMPRCDWHHWRGEFWVDESRLTPIEGA